jgi:hypothetical protein
MRLVRVSLLMLALSLTLFSPSAFARRTSLVTLDQSRVVSGATIGCNVDCDGDGTIESRKEVSSIEYCLGYCEGLCGSPCEVT